jgi:hypothetical protein
MLLELAVWKSKITEQLFGQNKYILNTEMKMLCRTDSISMVRIIVTNVLSFLTDNRLMLMRTALMTVMMTAAKMKTRVMTTMMMMCCSS